jgi:copper homeostasis protein
MSFTLEVIAFNIESCLIIQQSGANRIELCDNPAEGGTTPSYGFIKKAREKVTIDLFPIIRPRGGDFLYSEEEYAIMQQDIIMCKELGCDGVVLGMLNKDGSVDTERTKHLVALAYPLDVTFHRAFDRVNNAEQALEEVIRCGCTRILTSGLHPTVNEGKTVLKKLVEQADNRIIIMPGSGLRASNVQKIAAFTGAVEFHTSARKEKATEMLFTAASMQEELTHTIADKVEIFKILNELEQTKFMQPE